MRRDHERLLKVLGAEEGDVGRRHVEQLADDCRDAAKWSGPRAAPRSGSLRPATATVVEKPSG